jgi:hypothetical protein
MAMPRKTCPDDLRMSVTDFVDGKQFGPYTRRLNTYQDPFDV